MNRETSIPAFTWRVIGVLFTAAVILFLLASSVGCTLTPAATSADLLTYETISAALREVKVGVQLYDQTVRSDSQARQEEMFRALEQSVLIVAGGPSSQPDSPRPTPEQYAAEITAAMRKHVANYAEQDRRRQALYAATVDNLEFAAETAERGRQFSLYRADVSEQWRRYLDAAGRAKVGIEATGEPDLTSRVTNCPYMDEAEKTSLLQLLSKLNGGPQ